MKRSSSGGKGPKRGGLATLVAAVAIIVAACGGASRGAPPEGPPAVRAASVARGRGPMTPVRPSEHAKALAEVGLDPKALPPLQDLTRAQRDRVMRLFSASLGVPCVGCHTEGDMRADTARKRVATRMYNEITRLVATEKGDPVFCDSCHHGAMWVLDRSNKDKISDYMSEQYAGTLKTPDGRDVECETCHGAGPDFAFLATWKGRPAPRIAPPPPPPPPPPVAATPEPAPAPKPATAPAPKRAPKPAGACGDKTNLCPLQKWMRANVATAVAADDTAKLAASLAKVATMAPDPSWTSWREMSEAAAEAAKRGDMKEARKSCRQCHGEYRDKWRASYRARPVR